MRHCPESLWARGVGRIIMEVKDAPFLCARRLYPEYECNRLRCALVVGDMNGVRALVQTDVGCIRFLGMKPIQINDLPVVDFQTGAVVGEHQELIFTRRAHPESPVIIDSE